MIHSKKLLSLLLALLLTLGACSAALAEAATIAEGEKPLVVGYSNFSGKFSGFFAKTDYDRDASYGMTQIPVVYSDRQGNPVLKGIEGEVRSYNGVDYTYYCPCDIDINFDEAANQTVYTIKMRDDITFSDGTPMTIDDLIFSYYVELDPSFTGAATLYAVPIIGLNNYRTQTTSDVYAKYSELATGLADLGNDYTWKASDAWTEEQHSWFVDHVTELWMADAQSIVDYVQANYPADAAAMLGVEPEAFEGNDGLQVAAGMALWGFGEYDAATHTFTAPSGAKWTLEGTDYPQIEDYYVELYKAYDGDAAAYWATENTGETADLMATAKSDFIAYWGPKDDSMSGGIPNIEGIKRLGDYEMSITIEGFDANAIYQISLDDTGINPLHYYGDPALYDYDNNQFGFPFGDLSIVEAKTDKPLGAGPYVFKSYENKVIYYEANPNYYLGEPKTKYVQFKETLENDKSSGVQNGTIDLTDPSLNATVVAEIQSYNSNGELSGDKIVSTLVDNLGYGYIGLNAKNMAVGGEPASEASKDLRKAFATLFSVYRDSAVLSYYGDRASVINYPISNTSWAAPQKSDSDYRVAYSVGVDGSDLYTADMSVDDRYAAALQASVEYLKAAGFTFDEATGKFTAAPEGAKLEYELVIPGDGVGNHPSFQIITDVKAALETIGITLTINDPTDSNVLWNKIESGVQEMWAAAWAATPDPDMYQVYHSSNVVGKPGSTESNHYHIEDPQLDELIISARTSPDQAFRKATYKICLDIILDWSVEVPVYQRKNVIIMSPERINIDTVTPEITTYWKWLHDLEKIEMN